MASRPRRPRAAPTPPSPEDELLEQFGQALAEPHPAAFLEAVSAFATVFAPDADLDLPEDITGAPAELVIDLLQRTSGPTVDAMVAVLRALAPAGYDGRFEFGDRSTLPRWLRELDAAVAVRAVAMVDLVGDADDVAVEVRLADGSGFTMMALVDHNLGTRAKDAFVLPERLDEVIEFWRRTAEPGTEVQELSLADAGERLREALDDWEDEFPLPPTDTWPLSRPLLEWVVRLLPEGGQGWPFESWSKEALRRLRAELELMHPELRNLRTELDLLLRYAASQGLGDPLRWSPASTEFFLSAWLAGEVPPSSPLWTTVPTALRHLVVVAHRERKVPSPRTRETIAVIDAYAGPAPRTRSRARRPAAPEPLDVDRVLDRLAAEVGGVEALDVLDTAPLAVEPLDLSGVPEDVVPVTTAIGALVTSVVDAFFDDGELRTAALRLLARIARSERGPLRDRVNERLTAAAIVWLVGKANDAFGAVRPVNGMTALLGVTVSPSTRAGALLASIGQGWSGPALPALGDPALLTSARRAAIIDTRDRARGTSLW